MENEIEKPNEIISTLQRNCLVAGTRNKTNRRSPGFLSYSVQLNLYTIYTYFVHKILISQNSLCHARGAFCVWFFFGVIVQNSNSAFIPFMNERPNAYPTRARELVGAWAGAKWRKRMNLVAYQIWVEMCLVWADAGNIGGR